VSYPKYRNTQNITRRELRGSLLRSEGSLGHYALLKTPKTCPSHLHIRQSATEALSLMQAVQQIVAHPQLEGGTTRAHDNMPDLYSLQTSVSLLRGRGIDTLGHLSQRVLHTTSLNDLLSPRFRPTPSRASSSALHSHQLHGLPLQQKSCPELPLMMRELCKERGGSFIPAT